MRETLNGMVPSASVPPSRRPPTSLPSLAMALPRPCTLLGFQMLPCSRFSRRVPYTRRDCFVRTPHDRGVVDQRRARPSQPDGQSGGASATSRADRADRTNFAFRQRSSQHCCQQPSATGARFESKSESESESEFKSEAGFKAGFEADVGSGSSDTASASDRDGDGDNEAAATAACPTCGGHRQFGRGS